MKTLMSRVSLALLILATSPVICLAATNPDTEETLWDWLVRIFIWAAGGWFTY